MAEKLEELAAPAQEQATVGGSLDGLIPVVKGYECPKCHSFDNAYVDKTETVLACKKCGQKFINGLIGASAASKAEASAPAARQSRYLVVGIEPGQSWIVQAESASAALGLSPDGRQVGRSASLLTEQPGSEGESAGGNGDASAAAAPCPPAAVQKAKTIIRVTLADGSARQYIDGDVKKALRDDIAGGLLPMDCNAEQQIIKQAKTHTTSGTLRKLAKSRLCLDSMYRPVWSHATRGLFWGAMVGGGLKLLDTLVTMFAIDPRLGFMTLAAIGGLFIPKIGPYVLGGLIFISIKTGMSMNVYMAIVVAGLVGALLGMLPGMAIGGGIGLLRSRWLPRAHDAGKERIPALTAVLLPAVGGAALICLYLFWLNPMAIAWLAK